MREGEEEGKTQIQRISERERDVEREREGERLKEGGGEREERK